MDQVAINYTNIFHCKTLQNLPKFGFLVWKQTIWQPCSGEEAEEAWIELKGTIYFSFYFFQIYSKIHLFDWIQGSQQTSVKSKSNERQLKERMNVCSDNVLWLATEGRSSFYLQKTI
jgi:hypothetical protein